MKKMIAAFLTALMLLNFLFFSFPSAQALTGFSVSASVSFAYLGETFKWTVDDVKDGIGTIRYSFDIYKDGQRIHYEPGYNTISSREFAPAAPGRYRVVAAVKDGKNSLSKSSDEITVKANPNRITKIEPVSATSLRITWNMVPGANEYALYRSTDMKNWRLVKKTAGTSFVNTYLKAGTRYFYKVSYYRPGLLDSGFGPAAAGVPMANTRITSLTSPSGRRIKMTWAQAAGASGYQVVMAASANGSYKSVRIVTGGTAATFSGVNSGTTLFF